MKRPFLGLWLLLTVSFAIFFVLSSFGDISIGDLDIQNSGMYTALVPQADAEADTEADTEAVSEEPTEVPTEAEAVAAEPAAPAEPQFVVDTLPQRILFIGDSMLEGLSPRLAAYAQHNGHKLYSVIWYGSHTKSWGTCQKLTEYINLYKPTFIFISLGGNELFVRDIKTRHLQPLKNILKQLGDTPYMWIAPPNWKPDTGINQLLIENVPADKLFISKDLKLARAEDKVHPTRVAAYGWFDIVVEWMSKNHSYRIKLEKPAVQTAKPNKVIALEPPK